MQIYSDSKNKIAVDDITLWANRCAKCDENTRFTFSFDSALCKWMGES